MNESETVQLHAIVEGRVQGVGFRAFVEQSAAYFGVNGWVRNRWTGEVEVLAEGDRRTLEQLLAALQRGPRGSNVTGVQAEWQSASGEFSGFMVRRTG